MRVLSYAKLNLFLTVLGARQDAFHEILSVFVTVDLADELLFSPARGLPFSPAIAPQYSLISRAYSLLYEKCFRKLQNNSLTLCLDLKKHIPLGSGLGGGSSNAAVTLLALNDFYGLALSENELFACAADLGSDVPFFLKGGLAQVQGRGEILRFFDYACDLPFVIVYPHLHVKTAEAYNALFAYDDPQKSLEKCLSLLDALKNAELETLGKLLYNSFEAVQFEKYPVLRTLKSQLLETGALGALLSGSGSSVFAVFDSHRNAARIAQNLREKTPYSVFVARSLCGNAAFYRKT